MEALSKSFNLSDFEDPINMEPLTNIIRCPHDPTHIYQIGTLPKKIVDGGEYNQCVLTNEWFPSTEFKNDQYATNATNQIYKINKLYLEEKETNLILQNENKELKNEVVILTEKVNTQINNNENLTKQNENLTKENENLIEKEQNLTKKNENLTKQIENLIKHNENIMKIYKEKEELQQKNFQDFKNIFDKQECKHQEELERQKKQFKLNESYIAIHERMPTEKKDNDELKQEDHSLASDIAVNVAFFAIGITFICARNKLVRN